MVRCLILFTFVVDIFEASLTRLPERMLNTRLDGSDPLIVENTSLRGCIRTCEIITLCLSINFSKKTRKCQLFNKTANDSVPLVYSSGDIHVTMVKWMQIQSLQCSPKPCPDHALCLPNSDSYVCSFPTKARCCPGTRTKNFSMLVCGKKTLVVVLIEGSLTPPIELRYEVTAINNGQTRDSAATSSGHAPTTQDTVTNGSQTEGSYPLTTVPLPPDGVTNTTEGTATDDGSQSEGSNQLTTDASAGTTTTQGTGFTTEEACTTFVMNDLPDIQLSASSVQSNSSLQSDFYGPRWARLNTVTNGTHHGGGWLAGTNDQSQYIEVQFNQRSRVYAIFLQGYNGKEAWVTGFKVLYSTNCDNFSYKLNTLGSHEIYTGTYSSDQTSVNVIFPPIDALCFRLNPLSWYNNIGLRLDILACEVSAA